LQGRERQMTAEVADADQAGAYRVHHVSVAKTSPRVRPSS
jgi:hypothetical protein